LTASEPQAKRSRKQKGEKRQWQPKFWFEIQFDAASDAKTERKHARAAAAHKLSFGEVGVRFSPEKKYTRV